MCVHIPFRLNPIASLAWLGKQLPCPLRGNCTMKIQCPWIRGLTHTHTHTHTLAQTQFCSHWIHHDSMVQRCVQTHSIHFCSVSFIWFTCRQVVRTDSFLIDSQASMGEVGEFRRANELRRRRGPLWVCHVFVGLAPHICHSHSFPQPLTWHHKMRGTKAAADRRRTGVTGPKDWTVEQIAEPFVYWLGGFLEDAAGVGRGRSELSSLVRFKTLG